MHGTSNRLTLQPGSAITIDAPLESLVRVESQDGGTVSIASHAGELTIQVEQEGKLVWLHTFTYAPAPPSAPDGVPQRRPRGRPRMSPEARAKAHRMTIDDAVI